jgi:hypothetical protein
MALFSTSFVLAWRRTRVEPGNFAALPIIAVAVLFCGWVLIDVLLHLHSL